MWKCPKCGREFKNKDQQHYCGKAPSTIDEYFAAQDVDVRPYLIKVRDALRKALPDAEETISWSMPTYRKKHNLIHFAAQKKHIGIYPGGEATAAFAKELSAYDTSKGTIRIPYEGPLPLKLIQQIAKWSNEKEEASMAAAKKTTTAKKATTTKKPAAKKTAAKKTTAAKETTAKKPAAKKTTTAKKTTAKKTTAKKTTAKKTTTKQPTKANLEKSVQSLLTKAVKSAASGKSKEAILDSLKSDIKAEAKKYGLK